MRLDDLLSVTQGIVKVHHNKKVYPLFLDYDDTSKYMTDVADVKHLLDRQVIKIIPLGNDWSKYIKVILNP